MLTTLSIPKTSQILQTSLKITKLWRLSGTWRSPFNMLCKITAHQHAGTFYFLLLSETDCRFIFVFWQNLFGSFLPPLPWLPLLNSRLYTFHSWQFSFCNSNPSKTDPQNTRLRVPSFVSTKFGDIDSGQTFFSEQLLPTLHTTVIITTCLL